MSECYRPKTENCCAGMGGNAHHVSCKNFSHKKELAEVNDRFYACPECGEQSEDRYYGTTLAYIPPFHDANHNDHDHDSNHCDWELKCSSCAHEWSKGGHKPCWCGWPMINTEDPEKYPEFKEIRCSDIDWSKTVVREVFGMAVVNLRGVARAVIDAKEVVDDE